MVPKGRAEEEGDTLFLGDSDMKVIKAVVEDKTLSTAEKVLFAILYCRREGNECTLSVQEIVHYLGVELEVIQESLQNLEQGGFIKFKKDCDITDASSFLSCAVLGEDLKHQKPDVPRP